MWKGYFATNQNIFDSGALQKSNLIKRILTRQRQRQEIKDKDGSLHDKNCRSKMSDEQPAGEAPAPEAPAGERPFIIFLTFLIFKTQTKTKTKTKKTTTT